MNFELAKTKEEQFWVFFLRGKKKKSSEVLHFLAWQGRSSELKEL